MINTSCFIGGLLMNSVTIGILKMQYGEGLRVNDNTIIYAKVVSVSASYSRCSILTFSSCIMTHFALWITTCFLVFIYIYSIDTILYLYTLPLIQSPYSHLKSLPKCNLSSKE